MGGGWYKTVELLEEEKRAEEREKAEKAAEQKSVKNQKEVGITGAGGEERMASGSTSESSGVTGPTIGTTTIASSEAAEIRDAVRSELRKMFPGIARFEAESANLNRGAEPGYSESAAATVGKFSR